ncbi:glycosyltransferase family 2 protein [Nocardioides sp. SYSU D00038]|uniref:glycosyltransferase family 2 protein n=1 Tax=Nocardioides sp. SYSU D00038 TaxID=2812554 RepID=UPI00196747CB|nr:galactosyltransferase-related protein [Nocardioides sp. SYSU D00038]
MTSALPGVAVVTIAHGRHDHLALQHRSLAAATARPADYVVVAMHDPGLGPATVDGLGRRVRHLPRHPEGLPLAAARNLGVTTALEAGAEVVVVLDVDCAAGPGLVASYAEVVRERPGHLWCGPVTYLPPPPSGGYRLDDLDDLDDPHPARPAPAPGEVVLGGDPDLFWSLSFAVHRDTWRRVGGFHEGYVGYGAEDTDLGHTAAAAGVDLAWAGAARAYHQHHPVSRPPVEHLDDILRNGRRFRDRWGRWAMTGWLEEMAELGLVARQGDDWVRSGSGPHGYARPLPATVRP